MKPQRSTTSIDLQTVSKQPKLTTARRRHLDKGVSWTGGGGVAYAPKQHHQLVRLGTRDWPNYRSISGLRQKQCKEESRLLPTTNTTTLHSSPWSGGVGDQRVLEIATKHSSTSGPWPNFP